MGSDRCDVARKRDILDRLQGTGTVRKLERDLCEREMKLNINGLTIGGH